MSTLTARKRWVFRTVDWYYAQKILPIFSFSFGLEITMEMVA